MIRVHRLTHPDSPVWLNPDLILTVEVTPDTVISLTNGQRLVVDESPDTIMELVRDWRAAVIAAVAADDPVKSIGVMPIT